MLDRLPYLEYVQQAWSTRLQAHYEARAPPWPKNACDRSWFVKSARDGRTHTLTATTQDALWRGILDLHPIRILYTATSPTGTYHEIPFFFTTPQAAIQAVRILHDDFDIPLQSFQVTRVPRYIQVLLDDPAWQHMDAGVVRELVEYLHPIRFQVPDRDDEPVTPHQRRFHEHFQLHLRRIQEMDVVQRTEHLRTQARLAADVEEASAWLPTASFHEAAKHTALSKHLRREALQTIFPCPNRDKTLQAPRIHWNGSIDIQAGTLVPATPNGVRHVPQQP